ncbi:hypothetical protein [Cetobacterium sp.]|uniref:hypothetical protein n=1 Tax=Cetobacterium sp. TaxID=2071632 RepID=UPI003F34E6F2
MGFINKLVTVFVLLSIGTFGSESLEHLPMKPLLPIYPDGTPAYAPIEELDQTSKNEEDKGRALEKMNTLMLQIKTNVYVPLEIISDVDIEATLVDDQEVIIPFNIETNKQPDKKDYYKLKFSENEVDIDKDGTVDTYLYSTKYINSKISDGNYVNIKGSGISTDGTFYKKIYLTIEVE